MMAPITSRVWGTYSILREERELKFKHNLCLLQDAGSSISCICKLKM